ncbi:peptidylprolyl isomerase [bacterium]|nr:peptidylprolyl isomerase [bacterium]
MKTIPIIIIIASLFGSIWGFGLSFKDDGSVDTKIVAVVGNKPILSSELDQMLLTSAVEIPKDSSDVYKLYGQILGELIDEELVYQSALAESIEVDEDMLKQEFSARWDSFVVRFGTEKALAETLTQEGMSIVSFKKKVKNQVKMGLLKQMYIQKHITETEVSDEELRKFYDDYKDSLGEYPEQIELSAILISLPSDSIIFEQTRKVAQKIYDTLVSGIEFNRAVQNFSQDEITMKDNGELGEFSIDDLPQNFKNAIDKLKTGEYSKPVKSEKGYHILKLIFRKNNKVKLAHIFVELPIRNDFAKQIANAVYDSARNGTDFQTLLIHHTADSSLLANNGKLGTFPATALPPALETIADSLGAGTVIPPLQQNGQWAVFRIDNIIPEEPMTLDKHANFIRQLARRKKFSDKLSRLIEKLHQQIYVEVKDKKIAPYVR